jgi:hypothetical protein
MTEDQAHCSRHAFSDGECVTHGCWNCPGRAERRLADINARQRDERARSGRMTVWLAIAALVPFLAVAAIAGAQTWPNTRIAHAHQ